jgi:hypothetical protein
MPLLTAALASLIELCDVGAMLFCMAFWWEIISNYMPFFLFSNCDFSFTLPNLRTAFVKPSVKTTAPSNTPA